VTTPSREPIGVTTASSGRRHATTAARRSVAAAVVSLALVVTAVVTIGVGVGATSAHGTAGEPAIIGDGPTRVLVVGDSVLEGTRATLPGALAGREVLIDTEVSRSTGQSVEAALTHGTDWDVVIVLLGHNDGGSPNAYQPPYRRLFDTFAGAPRIVALTIHEVRPYYSAVNAFVRDEASRRPNVRVLDWNAIASAHPGSTAGDGLHLTPAGADLVAREIAGQVATAEVELAPTTTTTTTTTAPTTTVAPATTAAPTTVPTTTTTVPTTTSTAPTTRIVAATADTEPDDVAAGPPRPQPHTPRWAWPGVLAGFAALGAVLLREHRRRSPG
jgi:lysophospholipase L1-like esterase